MAFGREFSEKLTSLTVATTVCCTTATIAPGLGVLALVEALLGVAAVAHLVVHRSTTKADALLRRCAGQVEKASDALLQIEYRDDPDAAARRDAAIAEIEAVLPLIVPRARELVDARLNDARIVDFYLDRAARARPAVFANNPANELNRRLFQDVVRNASQVISRQPEFAAEVLQYTLAELLRGQEAILGNLVAQDKKLGNISDDNERRHREVLEAIARDKGVDPIKLVPLFEHLGLDDLTLDEMRLRAEEAIEAILARARQKVEPSNDGTDIDATISAARARLGTLDTAGTRSILAAKIAEEKAARRQRLLNTQSRRCAIACVLRISPMASGRFGPITASSPSRRVARDPEAVG